MFRKAKWKEFKELYRKRLVKDFPANERPRLRGFRRRMEKHQEKAYFYQEEGIVKGYILVDEIEDYILISFLAVYEEYRGKGIGSRMLNEIQEKYQDKKGILLEVENPKKEKNTEKKTIKERRISFYEKAGYQKIPDLELEIFFESYLVMILEKQGNKISSEEVGRKIKKFYSILGRRQKRPLYSCSHFRGKEEMTN